MSKEQVSVYIKRELSDLNHIIDQKIIRGFSYHKEARRHKELLRKLKQTKHRQTTLVTSLGKLFSRSFV